MRRSFEVMAMGAVVELVDGPSRAAAIEHVSAYWQSVDERFSPFKNSSELEKFNRFQIKKNQLSPEMKEVLALCEKTRQQTDGYFNVQRPDGKLDPCGLVKGWAIKNAADWLRAKGYHNFYLEISGDIELAGRNVDDQNWRIGVRDPFNDSGLITFLCLSNCGIATSGTYLQGPHVINPILGRPAEDIVSVTVIGPNIYEADRFATAALAMGYDGVKFIEKKPGLEGLFINNSGHRLATSEFKRYCEARVR